MDFSQIVLAIVVIGGFTAVLSYVSYRQKQSAWVGEVISKQHEEASSDDEGFSPEKFKVTFKTSAGKKIMVDVFEKEFNSYNIGDKAEKKAGDYFPTKLTS